MKNTKNQQKKKNPVSPKNPVQKKTVAEKKGFTQWGWLAVILALTCIVFIPSLNNALTNWDDSTYLDENPLIRSLSMANIKRIFSEVYFGNYQPLHIFSYAVEYHFYKLNPTGYHTTSLVMHLIATGLVCWFIYSLTESPFIALITALLFGIHPLHVESVAWAAERKDLLYANFFLASLIAYIKYIRSQEKMKYLFIAFLFFTLSILSKAMATSLAPVLILLDIYFRRKMSAKLVLEKVPFFVLAFVFGFIATHVVTETGQVSLDLFSLFERILFANFNLLMYVGKLILPIQLSSFYPYPARVEGSIPFYFYLAPLVVITLAFFIIRSLKKTKVIFFGAGFFFLCIALVLQLFPVGPTIFSERYSYLPSIGFFFVIAWFIRQLLQQRPSLKTPLYIGLAGYSLFLGVTTYKRCDVWKDSFTLWSNVLEQFPNAAMALNNVGNIVGKERGQLDLAFDYFNRSIFYSPNYENAYANRGIVYCMRGKFDLALKDFDKAIALRPNYYEALFNRGIAYSQTQQYDRAIVDFTALTKLKTDDAAVYLDRGIAYAQLARYSEALSDFNMALSINPSYPDAYYQRSSAMFNLHRYREAFDDVKQASALGYKVDQNYFETIRLAAEKR